MLNDNLISEALKVIQEKVKTLSTEETQKLDKTLDISITELCYYQEAKSAALIDNDISLTTSIYIYNNLNSWDTANLSDKIMITEIMAYLTALKMKRKNAKAMIR